MRINYQHLTFSSFLLALLFTRAITQSTTTSYDNYDDDDGIKVQEMKHSSVNDCPRKCMCLGGYVDCSKISLSSIAFQIPIWVENLDLSKNQLNDSLAEQLINLPRLVKLNLKRNALTEMPEFVEMTNLAKLTLTSNNINKWKANGTAGMPQLKQLIVSKNKLTELRCDMFHKNNTIKILNLNSNSIREIEPGVFKNLQALVRLELNSNKIETIPGLAFEHLNNVTVLRLQDNNINYLNDGAFHGLSQIEVLELDSNKIKKIRKAGLFNLSSLSIFSLTKNLIDTIEQDGWEYCRNLMKLDLSYNKLEKIERNMLNGLHSLKILDLRANSIDAVAEHAFQSLSSLEALYLNENKISWIVEDMNGPFLGLASLQILDLSSNYIKAINKNAFLGLGNLHELDLSENEISSIENNVFMNLRHLETLSFNSSKLLCDCNMTWFFLWLNETKMKIDATCGFPTNKKGFKLSSLSLTNFECDQSPKPILIDEPKSQLAIKYNNITLKCTASSTSNTPMFFKWKHDNVELTGERLTTRMSNSKNSVELYDGDNDKITSNGDITTEVAIASAQLNTTILTSVLILRNVTQERTGGKYQCIVSNNFGTTYSAKSRIAVVTYPKFRKEPQDIKVNAGETARLDCAAEGDPKPQIYWEKDGGNDFIAAREKRMRVMPEDDAFFITNVKVSDMGTYSCTAESVGGMIKSNATVVVYESPSFVKPMENKEVISGKSSVLECMASGFPKPKLQWLKDNRPIDASGRHFFAADYQLLIIVDTSLSDAGVYKCTMINDRGTKFDYMKLTVVQASTFIGVGYDFLGIIVIIIVACCVGTSIIWVVIIYQTRRRTNGAHYEPSNLLTIVPAVPAIKLQQKVTDNGSSPDYTAVDDMDSFNELNNLEDCRVLSSHNNSEHAVDMFDANAKKLDENYYMLITTAAVTPTSVASSSPSLCTNDGMQASSSKEKISHETHSTIEAVSPHTSEDETVVQTGERNDQLQPLLNSGASTPTIVQVHKKQFPSPTTVTTVICDKSSPTK